MKAAIIGGGVCGLYLAKNLAQKGIKVTVFERKKTIGKACCSGLFSERLFEHIPEAKPLATNKIRRAIINFPKRRIELRFRQPFYVIEHARLDLIAAALAANAGADIHVNRLVSANDLDGITREFERVIGCDGALSPTRKFLGLPDPEFMLGIQAFEPKRDQADSVETWTTPNGFLWRIPRGGDIEWGIMEKPALARKLFDEFMAKNGAKIGPLASAIIPQGLIIPKNSNITLCGDASGITKPWSGGGVIWNLKQADILLKNFPNFLQYKREAQSFFRFRILIGKTAKTVAYAVGFKFPGLIPQKFNLDGDFLFLKK